MVAVSTAIAFPHKSTAEHLSFYDFEFVYTARHAAGVPAHGQPRMDGIPVTTQVTAEPAQFGRTGVRRGNDPLVKATTRPLTHELQELLGQPTRLGQLNAVFVQPFQQGLPLSSRSDGPLSKSQASILGPGSIA